MNCCPWNSYTGVNGRREVDRGRDGNFNEILMVPESNHFYIWLLELYPNRNITLNLIFFKRSSVYRKDKGGKNGDVNQRYLLQSEVSQGL